MNYHTVAFDGNALLHRTMLVGELQKLSTSDGRPSGAVLGLLRSVKHVIDEFSSCQCIVVWDGGRSKRKMQEYPEYKAHRKITEPEQVEYFERFFSQREWIINILSNLGVKMVELSRREADDVMFLLIPHIFPQNLLIITEDRDLIIYPSKYVSVLRPIAGELITESNFEEKTKVPDCRAYLLYRAMCGNMGNNITGIRGFGDVSARKVIYELKEYTVESLWEWLESGSQTLVGSTRYRELLRNNFDIVRRNYSLMDPSKENWEESEVKLVELALRAPPNFDPMAALKALGELEMESVVKYYHRWVSSFQRLNRN